MKCRLLSLNRACSEYQFSLVLQPVRNGASSVQPILSAFCGNRSHGHQQRPWLLQDRGSRHGPRQLPTLDITRALGGNLPAQSTPHRLHRGPRWPSGLRYLAAPHCLHLFPFCIFPQSANHLPVIYLLITRSTWQAGPWLSLDSQSLEDLSCLDPD